MRGDSVYLVPGTANLQVNNYWMTGSVASLPKWGDFGILVGVGEGIVNVCISGTLDRIPHETVEKQALAVDHRRAPQMCSLYTSHHGAVPLSLHLCTSVCNDGGLPLHVLDDAGAKWGCGRGQQGAFCMHLKRCHARSYANKGWCTLCAIQVLKEWMST